MKKTTLRGFMLATITIVAAFFPSCNTEDVEYETPELSVSQSILNVTGTEASFEITTNRPWSVDFGDTDWIVANPAQGIGDGSVELSLLPNDAGPREADIKVKTTTVYSTVRVIQKGAYEITQMFAMNFGNQTGTLDFNAMAQWGASGTSSAGVNYAGNVQFRDTFKSEGYTGASGGQAIYAGTAGLYFQINNMNINTGAARDYYITFGSALGLDLQFYYENLILEVSIDGGEWTEVKYLRTDKTSNWRLATSSWFNAPANATSLAVKFTCKGGNLQMRIDDIKLFAKGDKVISEPIPAIVTTEGRAVVVTDKTASIVDNTYTYTGLKAITEVGIAYGESDDIATGTMTEVPAGAVVSPFTIDLSGLTEATAYSYKAYVKLEGRTFFGALESFITDSQGTTLPATLSFTKNAATTGIAGVLPDPVTGTLLTYTDTGCKLERLNSGGKDISYTASNSSIYNSNWDTPDAAWLITIPLASELAVGDNLSVKFNAFGTATSPKQWNAEYSTDNKTTWTEMQTGSPYSIISTSAPGALQTISFTIGAGQALAAKGKLYIRLVPIVGTTAAIGGNAVVAGGNSRLVNSVVVSKTN